MANSSKIHRKCEHSIANFFSQILFKVESNKWKSNSIFRTSRKRDNNSITNKPWYFIIY